MVAKQFKALSLEILNALIQSPFNEERLLALFILTIQYKKSNTEKQKLLYDFYLQNIAYINNWNLVDSSAHLIIGAHLQDKDTSILCTLAHSSYWWLWWHRRIAIIATWHFIKNDITNLTFDISTLLVHDTHDLIHKAVGWMLREAGKKNQIQLIQFLDIHASYMPRTMVRYAIEKLDQSVQQRYFLKKKTHTVYSTSN